MGCLAKTFYHLGKWTASRPITNIFIGCIIIMIGTFGFINFQATVSNPFANSQAAISSAYESRKCGVFDANVTFRPIHKHFGCHRLQELP